MQLRFDATTGDDDEAFDTVRAALLEEFEQWLVDGDEGDEDDAEGIAGDAGVLLDWRYRYSTGELDRYADGDIAEFLLEWCPRKVSAPPEFGRDMAIAISLFVQFLAGTDRLDGGAERATRLGTLAVDLAPQAERAMGDSSKFGIGKSVMGAFGDLPDTDDLDELQAVLNQRMEAFNALPLAERRALTDHAMPTEPMTDVPAVYVPLPRETLVDAAAASSLVRQVDIVHGFVGTGGRAVDEHLRLASADEHELAALIDPSAADPDGLFDQVRFVVDVAVIAEAIFEENGRLIAAEDWTDLDALERAEGVADALLDEGILAVRSGVDDEDDDETDMVTDAATVALLVKLFVDGNGSIAELTDDLSGALDMALDGGSGRGGADFATVFHVLHQLGIIATDADQEDGDIVALTPLGRHVVSHIAPAYGFRIPIAPDLADAAIEDLFELLLDPAVHGHDALAAWQPTLDDDDRARLIAEAMAATDRGAYRMVGIGLLNDMDPAVAEPHVRSLLGTPATAGHGALWLISHELETPDALEHFVGIGVLVDTLAATLAVPEVTVDMFAQLDDPQETLDELWRYDAPETAAVLEVLGDHLEDRRLAKAARKTLFRHRSWMANKTN
ncbi:hypothetical protein [Desertimonas flava]|uniref:hypothetical protein n=1 Tax=Desertimonas flava TaxID=2064846 RepID=UPI000E34522A|nr:hypothetical protein [Desertimonas flava]